MDGLISQGRNNYFTEIDFFDYDLDTGIIRDRNGNRIVSLTNDFLLGFWKGLIEECEHEGAHFILHKCGTIWGKRYAKRIEQDLEKFYNKKVKHLPMAIFNASLVHALKIHGWGNIEVNYEHHQQGIIMIAVKKPIMGSIIKKSAKPVEAMLAGALAEIFSYFAKQELGCIQTQCVACGANESLFILTLSKRIELLDTEQFSTHNEILNKLLTIAID